MALLITAGFQNVLWRCHPSKRFFTDEKTNKQKEEVMHWERTRSQPGKKLSKFMMYARKKFCCWLSNLPWQHTQVDLQYLCWVELHMFMVFIVPFPSLWLLSWHPSGIQTLQILLAVKIVNTALLGLQNIKCAVWQQMLCGRSAPVISEGRHHPGETHSRQSTNIQKTFLHLNLCYALGFFC